jgi:hypothetical protein
VNDHESFFVSAFVIAKKRQRYLTLLGNPKHRAKILGRLSGGHDIDYSLAQPVPIACGTESLTGVLKGMGAGPTCYVIADASEMDGKTLPLGDALWKTSVHGFGVVLSCLPGRLCFYKPESPTSGFILERS